MKKISKRNIIAVSFLLLFGLVLQGCHRHGKYHAEEHMADRISSKLNLSEEQEEKLEGILKKTGDEWRTMKMDSMEDGKKIADVFAVDTLDKDKVKELIAARKEQLNKRVDAMSGVIEKIHELLTPEQRKKAVENISQFIERRFNREHSKG